MAVVNGYLALSQLKNAVGDTTDKHIPEHERAINAASRQIDLWTGRFFYRDPVATPRLLNPVDRTVTYTGDFDSTTDVVVATDVDGDGVFETLWTSDQWQAEPFVRWNGWPYTQISTTTRTTEFPVSGRRPNVQITARWGWAAVPGPIEQACEALAVLYYRTKDSSAGGMIKFDQSVEVMSTDPVVIAANLCRQYVVEGGSLYVPPAPVEMEKPKRKTGSLRTRPV